jgi:hypothetical protein
MVADFSHPDHSRQDCIRQRQKDQEAERAWDSAPESFKRKAEEMGLIKRKQNGNMDYGVAEGVHITLEFNDNLTTSCYTPDFAEDIDTHIDHIVEKYGIEHELMIRSIASDLQKPMEREIELNRALTLTRVIGFLIKEESHKILPRIHQLMHAIPKFAALTGFPSLRASARECKVSPEWMRKGRNAMCEMLGIPIPADEVKSDAAKEKYRIAATERHWRRQTYKNETQKPQNEPCPTNSPQPA